MRRTTNDIMLLSKATFQPASDNIAALANPAMPEPIMIASAPSGNCFAYFFSVKPFLEMSAIVCQMNSSTVCQPYDVMIGVTSAGEGRLTIGVSMIDYSPRQLVNTHDEVEYETQPKQSTPTR